MVAIKNHEADRYLQSPPAHVLAYLIYGPDVGLVHERAVGLFRKLGGGGEDAFSSVRLSGDDIAADPARLADEMYSTGLFGGKRTVLVTSGSRNFASSVETILKDPAPNSALIVEAGALRRDAPLRVMFERARDAVSIECYADTAQDLLKIVKTEAQKANLRISDEVAAELVLHLGSDRAASRSEIEKLVLYASGAGAIISEDIEAVVADASALAIDTAIASAFLGVRSTVTETAIRAFETGNDAGVLLGFALRHCSALHRARASMEAGRSFESATAPLLRGTKIQTVRQSVQEQMSIWSSARLLRATEVISDAIRKCRRDPRLDQLIAIRAMWSVAQAARSKD